MDKVADQGGQHEMRNERNAEKKDGKNGKGDAHKDGEQVEEQQYKKQFFGEAF